MLDRSLISARRIGPKHYDKTALPVTRQGCRLLGHFAMILTIRSLVFSPIQEGDDLCTGAGLVGGEAVVANAGGDALLHHRAVILFCIQQRQYLSTCFR